MHQKSNQFPISNSTGHKKVSSSSNHKDLLNEQRLTILELQIKLQEYEETMENNQKLKNIIQAQEYELNSLYKKFTEATSQIKREKEISEHLLAELKQLRLNQRLQDSPIQKELQEVIKELINPPKMSSYRALSPKPMHHIIHKDQALLKLQTTEQNLNNVQRALVKKTQDYNIHILELQNENRKLKKKLESSATPPDALLDQIKSLTKQNASQLNQIELLKQENFQLKSHDKQLNQQESQLQKQKQISDNLKQELLKLNQQNEILNQTIKEQSIKIKNLDSKCLTFKQQIEDLTNKQIEEISNQKTLNKQDKDQLTQLLQEKEKKINILKLEVDGLKQNLDVANTPNQVDKGLQDQLQLQVKKNDENLNIINDQKSIINKLQQQIEQMSNLQKIVEEKIPIIQIAEQYNGKQSSDQLFKLQASFNQLQQESKSQYDTLQQDKQQIEYQNKSLSEENHKLQASITSLLQELYDSKKLCEEEQTIIQNLKDDKQKLGVIGALLQTNQVQSDVEIIKVQETKIMEVDLENQLLQNKLHLLEKRIFEKEEENDGLSKRVEAMRQQIIIDIDLVNKQKDSFFEKMQEDGMNEVNQLRTQCQDSAEQYQQSLKTIKEQQYKYELLESELDQQKKQSNNEQSDNKLDTLRIEYEEKIKILQSESQSQSKLQDSQIKMLNKKISELQDHISKKTLELQKNKGNRRTSQLFNDTMSIQLIQKQSKIDELQKNLIETKQSYEELLEKAKLMDERNKQLKEKMLQASKLIKKDEDGEQSQNRIVWDLTINNEFQDFISLGQRGWTFIKGSSAPMNAFKRFQYFISFDSQQLCNFLQNQFNKEENQQINDLQPHKIYLKIFEDTCVMSKVFSASSVPSRESTSADSQNKQLWEELWIDFALKESDMLCVLIDKLEIQQDMLVKSLIRLNPGNLVIIVNQGAQQQMICEYLSKMFSLPFHNDDGIYSNNRTTVIPYGGQIITYIKRAAHEEERLFLDLFKSYLAKKNQFFASNNRQIKITKMVTSNTFNYLMNIDDLSLNMERIPILIDCDMPYYKLKKKGENQMKITYFFKGCVVDQGGVKVVQLSQHSQISACDLLINVRVFCILEQKLTKNLSFSLKLPLKIGAHPCVSYHKSEKLKILIDIL